MIIIIMTMTNPNVLPQTMAECYLDRQPELLCNIFDKLDQERPAALSALFSPGPSGGSTRTSSSRSNKSWPPRNREAVRRSNSRRPLPGRLRQKETRRERN